MSKKEFDKIKKDYHCQESHSQGHFNRKNKIFTNNNFISKSIHEIHYNKNSNIKNNNDNIRMSYSPNDNNIKNNINNIKSSNNNNFSGNNKKNKITKIKKEYKTKKDNKTKKIEESEKTEQDQKKIEYIDALVKNGVLNVTKELNIIKKLTPKEIMNRKKKEFLQENGVDENIINNNDK